MCKISSLKFEALITHEQENLGQGSDNIFQIIPLHKYAALLFIICPAVFNL